MLTCNIICYFAVFTEPYLLTAVDVSESSPKTKSIAIAVVAHDDKFIIGQRPEGVTLAGYWEFPGGKVEYGETPEQAAVRECLEETGQWVRVVGDYPTFLHDYGHVRLLLHFFACEMREVPSELRSPFRWVSRKQLADYEFPEGNQHVLKLLLAINDET